MAVVGLCLVVAGYGAYLAMLFVLQPGYMNLLFTELIGVIAVVGGGILSVIGWFWLSRIVKIEV